MGNVVLSVRLCQEQPTESGTNSQLVETDKFHAGECLTGEVLVGVEKRVWWGGQLTLHAFGYEKTAIATGKKNQRIHRNERVFFQATTSLGNVAWRRPTTDDSDKYCFPFSIPLPESLPRSFSHGSFEHGCMIRYVVRAQVGQSQTCHQFFLTSAPLPSVVVPCFLEPQTETIKSLGVKRMGTVTFGVGVKDTQVGKGSEIELSLACQNNSSASIEHVDFKVIELVTWRVKKQKQQTKTVLVNATDVKLPGLATDRLPMCDVRNSHRDGVDVHSRNYELIYSLLRSPENAFRVEIPTSTNDTYSGSILSVSHYVKVYLQTKRFVDNLSTKIPLHIGSPPEGIAPEPSPLPSLELPASIEPSAPLEPDTATPVPSAPRDDDDGTYIPFAAAVPIPPEMEYDVIHEAIVRAPPESVVLGGLEGAGGYGLRSSASEVSDLESLAPPASARPSLANLLREMEASVNDYDVLSRKVHDPRWKPLLQSLRPKGYGKIIAHVTQEFDQPRIARLLAGNIGNGFTCAHCVCALKNTASWNRIAVVQQLLPFCQDLDVQHNVVKAELTQWEQTVTARDFDGHL